jgi:hypothetical protein
MTNPFKQTQREQVIVKLTSKHHTTFQTNRIKIGAYIIFIYLFFFFLGGMTPLNFSNILFGRRNKLCIIYLVGNELKTTTQQMR